MPVLEREAVSTQPTVVYHLSASDGVVAFPTTGSPKPQSRARSKEVSKAVLTHIKALRALGKTRVNTKDIAIALDLPRVIVEQAVRQLNDEGVKIAR